MKDDNQTRQQILSQQYIFVYTDYSIADDEIIRTPIVVARASVWCLPSCELEGWPMLAKAPNRAESIFSVDDFGNLTLETLTVVGQTAYEEQRHLVCATISAQHLLKRC